MSLPVIVPPDVERWAINWLATALAARAEPYASGVSVQNRTPTPIPPRLVAFRHDGGTRADLLYTPARLGVNVYAASEEEVSDLASLVEGLLLSVQASTPVLYVHSAAGIQPIPDSRPRRYFSVEVLLRGVEA